MKVGKRKLKELENDSLKKQLEVSTSRIDELRKTLSKYMYELENLKNENELLNKNIKILIGIGNEELKELAEKSDKFYRSENSQNSKKKWKQEGRKWQN